MKKAVITSGGKQYLVAEGGKVDVELIKDAKDKVSFKTMLLIDGEKTSVGKPHVEGVKVDAKIIEADKQQEKVTSIRYKPKKRVRKIRGHRQRLMTIEVTKISLNSKTNR